MKWSRKKTTIRETKCGTCGGDAEFVTIRQLVPPGFLYSQTSYARCDTCMRRYMRRFFPGALEQLKARKQ